MSEFIGKTLKTNVAYYCIILFIAQCAYYSQNLASALLYLPITAFVLLPSCQSLKVAYGLVLVHGILHYALVPEFTLRSFLDSTVQIDMVVHTAMLWFVKKATCHCFHSDSFNKYLHLVLDVCLVLNVIAIWVSSDTNDDARFFVFRFVTLGGTVTSALFIAAVLFHCDEDERSRATAFTVHAAIALTIHIIFDNFADTFPNFAAGRFFESYFMAACFVAAYKSFKRGLPSHKHELDFANVLEWSCPTNKLH